jgi:hypothetical protein
MRFRARDPSKDLAWSKSSRSKSKFLRGSGRRCFALCAMNLTLCLVAYFVGPWIYDQNGLGIPTDFISVWAAGRLVLDGFAAQAFDCDILRRIEVGKLGQDFVGNYPWQYPPPFLFVASVLALLPYSLAYLGWVLASLVPYLAVMRGIVGHKFGVLLTLAEPFVWTADPKRVVAARNWTWFDAVPRSFLVITAFLALRWGTAFRQLAERLA